MRKMIFPVIVFTGLLYVSCGSLPQKTTDRLIHGGANGTVPGEGESEIQITWNGKSNRPLAVTLDYFVNDDAIEGETGRLAAQIDPGKTEKIVVKNGRNILHLGESWYTKNGWIVFDGTKINSTGMNVGDSNIPLTLENNTFTGTEIVCHPNYNTISIEVSRDKRVNFYSINVKKASLNTEAARRAREKPPEAAGAPPALPPAAAYMVAVNSQHYGPYEMPELRRMVEQGTLTRSTLVWKEGMAQWSAAGTITELAALFSSSPPPPLPSR
jgi:hypothetical protein